MIGIRTLFRWQRNMTPCMTRDKPATRLDMAQLAKDVEQAPDAYQWERAQRLGVAERTIGYGLQRLGISYKKTRQHPKANEQARRDFQNKIDAYESEGRTIMYLDESGFAQDMSRQHGYCYRGKRCYGVHDWHAKGRINVIGAMVGFGLVSVGLFKGSINSDVFYAWLTQALVPV